ncbi:MAG: hypothetical protein K2L97_01085 [Muribaculaceae bacterium]|nr:hypothetical protein [Muribaculaceae bacterium]
MLILASCNSKTESNSETEAADSIATEQVAETVHTQQSASIYGSDDLKKFGLKGQVTTVTVKYDNDWIPGLVDDNLQFDAQGKLISKLPDLKLTVNADGFISKVVDDMGASDGSETVADYTLNENGWPVKLKLQMSSPDAEAYADCTLTYPDVDEHGNWTKCVIKGSLVNIEEETGNEFEEPVNATITRVITY